MPHGRCKHWTPAKKRKKIAKDLDKRLQHLKKLTDKHIHEPKIITVEDVSLGGLRKSYKPRQSEIHSAVKRKARRFRTFKSSAVKPLLIYGSDGGLLAARVRLKCSDLIKQLSDAIDALPSLTKYYSFKGIKRSTYQTRHYGVWCPYMPEPRLTAEHRHDGEKADEFMKQTELIFKEMSAILGGLAPRVFKDFQLFPLPKEAQRACGAWAACVVNDGGNNPNQTNIHRDVKESRYGYSCVISCGNYTEGDLILYELGCKIQMRPGDMLLFPDSLIHHNNEKAQGMRKSVVAFTQENMFDYWVRKYRIHKRGVIYDENGGYIDNEDEWDNDDDAYGSSTE
jgi:hypothetical protein